MKGSIQFGKRKKQAESPLTPELKRFIDRAIVPGLLKLYLAERGQERQVAKHPATARQWSDDVAPRTCQEAL
jgi:hypothetical protein